jgi:ClpP class serine protease
MAWLLKHEVLERLRVARALSAFQPTLEERARFEVAMRERYAASDRDRPRNMQVAGDTASIEVDGVLTEKPDCFAMCFGGGNTTYESIRRALALAETDPAIKKIQLNVSSPGGEVTGLFETFAALESLTKPVNVRASLAASAAFGLAAVAWHIEALTPASEFGSIGVAAHMFVAEDEIQIASTEAPKKRPDVRTEEGQAIVREELDALHEEFVKAIARGRSNATGEEVTPENINADFGRGGVLLAAQAKKRGMIDRIATQPRRAPSGRRAESTPGAPDVAPPLSATAADGGSAEEKTMDLETLKSQHPGLYAAVLGEGEAKERKRVLAHLKAGKASGALDVAERAIASGASFSDEEIQSEYFTARLNKRDSDNRQGDSDTAGAATDNVAKDAPDATKDTGDLMADSMGLPPPDPKHLETLRKINAR